MIWLTERRQFMPFGAARGCIARETGGAAPPGNVSFIGSAYAASSSFNATTLNIDLSSTGRQSGDLIILQGEQASSTAAFGNLPSGFTALTNTLVQSPQSHAMRAFYKQSAGTEGSITVTLSAGSADWMQLEAVVYRYIDWVSGPFGGTVTPVTGTGTSANPPAVTTVVANELVVCGYGVNAPGGTFPTDAGGPTGFTVRINRLNGGIGSGIADKEQGAPGSVNPDTFGWGGSTDDWVSWTVGVRPA